MTAIVVLTASVLVWRIHHRAIVDGTAALPNRIISGDDRLIVEPDDGMRPIDQLLASPRRTLDMTMYELVDPTAESILVADAERGVTVRVILDRRLEGQTNAPAAAFLQDHGVTVHWASSRFFVSHEKTFVIDDTTAVVMSLNLTSRYYASTRDIAVVDGDHEDVAAIEAVFAADFDGRSITAPTGEDLAWSPDQSQADVLALINEARHSILVESEELSSQPVISALARAARRGLAVEVVMTDDPDWHAGFDDITAAGGRVSVLHGETPLYIHAKILAVDAGQPDARVLVGSQNLSDASLNDDRELGIVLTAPALVSDLGQLVESDSARGTLWS